MSYYRPSFSQTVAMSRGGRGFSSSRGGGYRGSGSRGSSWSSRGSYSSSSNPRFSSSFSNSFDSRSKYGSSSDRYSGGSRSHGDVYRKSYRNDSGGYRGRGDSHRSPDRKRMRTDNLSRHESSYGSDSYNRYESSHYPERRSFSGDRRPSSGSRREEFRKPLPPPSRGGFRGRIGGRGTLRARLREAPIKRRIVASYSRRRLAAKIRSAAFRYRKESSEREPRPKSKDKAEDSKSVKSEKEDSEEKEIPESQEKSPTKSIKKEAAGSDAENAKKDDESDDEKEKDRPRRKFIKLQCPHCSMICPTFRKYAMHLKMGRHMAVMRRLALKQKAILHQMRLSQRKAQKELESNSDDLAPRTTFCPLCKLNYKQPKAVHRATEAHINMKKFLMPLCKVCNVVLNSPMLYEDHLCSIEHLKTKSYVMNGDKSDEGSGDDNLENFMTIDSVGDVEDEEGGDKKKEAAATEDKKPAINVGIESIKKVEVFYCDLCLMYLPRVEESEVDRVLAKHCKQRTHMTRYIRFKEDKELAKRAERLQRKETAEKEKEKDKDSGKSSTVSPKKESAKNGEEEDAGDDKLWADVDKDLGDILAEAESGNKSSDEDDNERYDRFKLSEGKNGDDKKAADSKEEPAEEAMDTSTKDDDDEK